MTITTVLIEMIGSKRLSVSNTYSDIQSKINTALTNGDIFIEVNRVMGYDDVGEKLVTKPRTLNLNRISEFYEQTEEK
jgi:hypothetical protein